MSAENKLNEMGLELPTPPQPAGAYTRAVRSGNLIFVSGQLPLAEGQMQFTGMVGKDLHEQEGYAAARLCALNALSILNAEAGSLEKIRIIRLSGFVCSTADFHGQAQVINGASELMANVLGDRGLHARLAVGVIALPLGAAVELEVIAEVQP